MTGDHRVSIHWQGYEAKEISEISHGFWGVSQCAILGHRIYVFPEYPGVRIFELDVRASMWRAVPCEGATPKSIAGSSMFAIDDKLVFVHGRIGQLDSFTVFDTILLQWSEVPVSGDQVFATSYHASDYWESRQMVLVNARVEESEKAPNVSFQINMNTMEVRKLETRGPPPSRRHYHSSVLLEKAKRWVIICGQGPGMLLADIYFLDFNRPKPSWTRHAPFSKLRGVSVCSPLRIGSTLLLFGGVRRGLDNTKACSYDLQSGDVVEGLKQSGFCPPSGISSFQSVVKQNDKTFFFISSEKSRARYRVYMGRVHMQNER